jgi:hypothetical protein
MIALRKRLWYGAVGGLALAVGFSVWAGIGRSSMGAEAYTIANGPFLGTVLVYLGVLPLCGTLVALLWPLSRAWWGAMLLGTFPVAALIYAFGVLGSMTGLPEVEKLIASGIGGLLMGGGVAVGLWSENKKSGERSGR